MRSRTAWTRSSTPSSAAVWSTCCWERSRARRRCWRTCSDPFPTSATCISPAAACAAITSTSRFANAKGEAKNVMLGAFAGHYDVKHVIVVDEDVDIHNPAEVEWAVATRFQADRDLVVV